MLYLSYLYNISGIWANVDRSQYILEYCDDEYQLTYSTFSVRVAFFEALRVLIRRRYFASWTDFLKYVRGKNDAPL